MKSLLCTLALALVIVAPAAAADTLLIRGIEQDRAMWNERPARGSTMAMVDSRYGKPERIVQPVGDPPITRWVYGDFTVVFEHDRVLHSVSHR